MEQPLREFVFMDRAAVGIGSVLMTLGAELNWHELYENLIADFNTETLHQQQALLLQSVSKT